MYLIELQHISIKNSRKSAESAFYGGFSAENWPKYRKIALFFASQSREYLKITGNVLSWARNTLETPNLDQRYFRSILDASEGFFKILIFSALFRHFFANFWLKSVVTQWYTYENTK